MNSGTQQTTALEAALLEPIAVLMEELVHSSRPEDTTANPSSRERGLATALCLLLTTFLESAVMRCRQDHDGASEARTALQYLENQRPSRQFMLNLTEIFLLRDVIANSLAWEPTTGTDEAGDSRSASARLSELVGDRSSDAVLDPERGVTRSLGINIVPTRIRRLDVKKTLAVVWGTLQFLGDRHGEFAEQVATLEVPYSIESMTLAEFKDFADSAI
jgi:hypothetical protein